MTVCQLSVLEKWPAASSELLQADSESLSTLPIDHGVGPSLLDGGEVAARKQLSSFIAKRFDRYADERNQPDDDPSSGLSPYLHFGHVSAHEVFQAVANVRRMVAGATQ